jgi:inositol oxygenase
MSKHKFRDYEKSEDKVRQFYYRNRSYQTLEYVLSMEKKYSNTQEIEMDVWDALQHLNELVDISDPDTNLPQIQHALQTAESIRKIYPEDKYDWLHLVSLIHDLGKFMGVHYKEPQWAVVGDTFPVGCDMSSTCAFNQFFIQNPDFKIYNGDKYGIYKPNCGLRNVHMSWGHDEYLYRVCVRSNCKLPLAGLYIIRYHSFYPWHTGKDYMYLCDDTDLKMLKWVQIFNKFDLYSKKDEKINIEQVSSYYKKLIKKYFPEKLKF